MGNALDDLVARMFGGSGEALLMALVDTRKVTPEALARAVPICSRSVRNDRTRRHDLAGQRPVAGSVDRGDHRALHRVLDGWDRGRAMGAGSRPWPSP